MEQIFAPWRIEWVERTGSAEYDCAFCALPRKENDRESRIVARSEHSYVLLNNYPYNPGHAMVIPERHTGRYDDLTEEILLDHSRLTQHTIAAMREAFDPDGFNTGMNLGDGSGGSIKDHVHSHVVPRWTGDTNFMPVIGDTKVIVQAIEETWDRLHEGFAALPQAESRSAEEAILLCSDRDDSEVT